MRTGLGRGAALVAGLMLSVLALWVTFPSAAAAAPSGGHDDGRADVKADGSALRAAARRRQQGHDGQAGAAGTSGVGRLASTAPKPVVQWLVACRGNAASTTQVAESFCAQAVQACSATADPHDVLYWRFTLTSQPAKDSNGRPTGTSYDLWALTGRACLRPDQIPAVAALPTLTLADFQRLPLPPCLAHVQPDRGWALINVATNVYVDAHPVTFHTTLLGYPIEVTATPARYTWTFGEGPALTTTDPGGPYPAMTTTHTYRTPATYQITLTTFYTGDYSVAGGPRLTVDGQAHVTSHPIPIELIEARAHLIGGNAG